MKPFIPIIALVLLAALVAPFFLKVNGKPLMTVDDVVGDSINSLTPEVLQTKTQVYRWQDKHGVWQFGEEPPAQQKSEQIEITERLTPIARGWEGPRSGNRPETKVPSMPSLGGLTNPKKIMDDAKAGVDQMNARTEKLDSMLDDLRN